MDAAVVARWLIAAPLLALGGCIVLFNVYRYRLIRQRRAQGNTQRVSSIGLAGPLLLLLGLAAAPIEFRFWFLAVILLEVAAFDFSTEPEPPADDDGTPDAR